MTRPPPSSTLFPYTTLFRSGIVQVDAVDTSNISPVKMSIQLYTPQGTRVTFTNGSTEIFYNWAAQDRKSTRLNSSHVSISYAVFCLKKKNRTRHTRTRTPMD